MYYLKYFTAFLLFLSLNSYSADHLDGLEVLNDPSTDITDVYAWLNDTQTINLVLNVFPLANESSSFSDSAYYVFNISSLASYGGAGTTKQVTCSFNQRQQISCSLDNERLITNEDASSEAGVMSASSDFKVFAGLRDDPFFFDLENFNAAREFVRDNASGLDFDSAGCPDLSAGSTRDAIVGTLTGSSTALGGNGSPTDFFDDLNVLSIVVQLDKSLIGDGPIYSVNAVTHKR